MAGTIGLLYQSSGDHCHYDLIPLGYDFSRWELWPDLSPENHN